MYVLGIYKLCRVYLKVFTGKNKNSFVTLSTVCEIFQQHNTKYMNLNIWIKIPTSI